MLYDTRTRTVQTVGTGQRGTLRMYTCGPTVYRYAHVGNLRSYLLSDLIRRVGERYGRHVTVCQNITDVGHLTDDSDPDASGEDKVLAQARAEGRTALEIARHYEDAFRADLAALNIRPADHSPRASESIELMIDLIARLIDGGHAYPAADGSVLFDARSFPGYGELSGNRLTDLQPGYRSGGSVDASKRFHADWALWKPAAGRTELTWPTAVGHRLPRLAHRVLGDVAALPRRSTSTSTPAASTCASRTTRTSGPSPTRSPGTTWSGSGCTASTCCSRGARWPSPPGTWCCCPT